MGPSVATCTTASVCTASREAAPSVSSGGTRSVRDCAAGEGTQRPVSLIYHFGDRAVGGGRGRTRKPALTQRYAPSLTLLPGPWTCVLSSDSASRPIASRRAPRQLFRPGTAAAAALKAATGVLARPSPGVASGILRQAAGTLKPLSCAAVAAAARSRTSGMLARARISAFCICTRASAAGSHVELALQRSCLQHARLLLDRWHER